MSDSLRLIAMWAGVASIIWFFGYLFDRHMIGLIKQALNEREREKPGPEGNSRA